MKTIRELLLELVAVQSDTGTVQECAMADKLAELIEEIPYFKANPENFGTAYGDDPLKRPVVWALKRGITDKTLILMGHYDAVDLSAYGDLKEYALNPELLKCWWKKQAISDPELRADLENPLWMFGRGVADMKAGLAVNLYSVAEIDNIDVNILFLAVPDEENMSQGARMAADVLLDLKKRFQLCYKLYIISEPSFRSVKKSEPLRVTCGSTGKLLPVVVVKGKVVHAARVLSGLNAGAVISELTGKLELNPAFISSDQGHMTQPPTVQMIRDLKAKYDVSVPEYAAACYNLLFLRNREPAELTDLIINLTKEAYEVILKKRKEIAGVFRENTKEVIDDRGLSPQVMSLKELGEYVQQNCKGFPQFYEKQISMLCERLGSGELSLPEAGMQYIRALMEFSEIEGPLAVVGIAPPYYPPYHISCACDREVRSLFEGLELQEIPYTAGMTDLSYTCCPDPQAERAFMKNVALSGPLYDIPFEAIGKLKVPAVMIGPAGKAVHQKGERVYLPDVEENIPEIFRRIVENLAG